MPSTTRSTPSSTYIEGYVERRSGVAVLTNSDGGNALLGELLPAIAAVHGWPGSPRRSVTAVPVAAESLASLAGVYGDAAGGRIVIVHDNGELFTPMPYGRRALLPLGGSTFVDAETGADVAFHRDLDGDVTAEVRHLGEHIGTYTRVTGGDG